MVLAVPATFFSLEKFGLALLTLQASYQWSWRRYPMWDWSFGMVAMMALFWGAVIVACNRLIGHSKNSPGESAMIIFRERFARREIENDEFETRKRELSQGSYRERNLKGGVQWKIRMSNTGSI